MLPMGSTRLLQQLVALFLTVHASTVDARSPVRRRAVRTTLAKWNGYLVAVLVAGGVSYLVARRRAAVIRSKQESDFELRAVSKVADEDVTQFGEELQDLHIDTLTTKLDPAMRQDYQRALDAYENAKSLMRNARLPEDVTGVTKALEEGRYAKACVLARESGEPLPERRPPCFFNPAHGPAHTDVEWAPLGGVAREIPVCLADANRLAQGAEPEARMVRSGSKMVPWYEAGPRYAAYAQGVLRIVG